MAKLRMCELTEIVQREDSNNPFLGAKSKSVRVKRKESGH